MFAIKNLVFFSHATVAAMHPREADGRKLLHRDHRCATDYDMSL